MTHNEQMIYEKAMSESNKKRQKPEGVQQMDFYKYCKLTDKHINTDTKNQSGFLLELGFNESEWISVSEYNAIGEFIKWKILDDQEKLEKTKTNKAK